MVSRLSVSIYLKNMQKKKDRIMVQSNSLTTASYDLSKNGKRVLYLALNAILGNKNLKYDFENEGYAIVIKFEDYESLFGAFSNTYRDLKSSATQLQTKQVIFYDAENDGENGEKGLKSRGFINGFDISAKNKKITLYFSRVAERMIQYQESKPFTKYLLYSVLNLSSNNTMRLYESICQWRGEKVEYKFRIEWMIERYNLPKSYERMSDFRSKFLSKAVAEINEKSDITISCEELYQEGNKKPSHILIKWSEKDYENSIFNKNKKPEDVSSSPYEKALSTLLDIMTDAKDSFTQKEMENLSMHFFLMVSNKDAHPSDMDKILSVKREG